MTTIAYKDRCIAYDSRLTSGDNIILTDSCNKKIIDNELIFFLAGKLRDLPEIIKLFRNPNSEIKRLDTQCIIFNTETNDLFTFSCLYGEVVINNIEKDITFAIGSGRLFALAYMDTGMSAKQAVKFVKSRDPGTGGKINVFKF